MITKIEALQVWCPMVRLVAADSKGKVAAGAATCNRVQDQNGTLLPLSTSCVADGCAMWRWGEAAPQMPEPEEWTPHEDAYDDDGFLPMGVEQSRPDHVPADAVWLMPIQQEKGNWQDGGYWVESEESVVKRHAAELAKRRGFCGIAGRPE